MDAFSNAKNIYLAAQKAYDQKNLDECANQLSTLKIALVECTSFIPSTGNDPNSKEACLTRSSLELGVFHSIQCRDIGAFERYMKQLLPYYQDFLVSSGNNNKSNSSNQSAYTDQMTGLYLLFLLAKNEISQFHLELEKIDHQKLEASVYLQHPVKLEQSLMEGNYGKVFLARDNIPAPEYKFFMDELTSTIRSEIAECMEASFNKKKVLPIDEVARLLYYKQADGDFINFVNFRNWELLEGNVKFIKSQNLMAMSVLTLTDNKGSPTDTTNSMIDYAKEMEVII